MGSRGVLGGSRGIVFGAPGVAGSSPGLTYNFSNCYTSLFRDLFVAIFGFFGSLRAHIGADLWSRTVQIMAISCVLMFSGFQQAIFPLKWVPGLVPTISCAMFRQFALLIFIISTADLPRG